MKCYLIVICIALLKSSMLWGSFKWVDTKSIYPPVKVYFRDAEGCNWRIKERLAETLFIVAQAIDEVGRDELLETKIFHLMHINLKDSSIIWREHIPKDYFRVTTCNGVLLGFNNGKRRESLFFLRDGEKWVKPNGVNIRGFNWRDYRNGILLPGMLTGEPIAYVLSAEGLTHINGKPVTSRPWLGENGILGLSTYEADFQIFDIQSGNYYPLLKNYQAIYCVDLQTIIMQEKTGLHRCAIYDVRHNNISFFKSGTRMSAVEGFYYIFEKEGKTHVYNSKGKHFKWLGLPSIRAIRCPPYEILVVESNALKEVINATTDTRLVFEVEDELSIYDTFLKVQKKNGATYLIDLLTGEKISYL